MKDLSSGKESSLIFQFAWPMLLGNLFQQLYFIIDFVIIGWFVGKEAQAAVGASSPIVFALISMIIGFTMGATIIIAQFFGAKNLEKVRSAIDTLYIVLFVASLAVSILGIIFSEDILRLIRLPEEILKDAKLFLVVYLSGLVFMFGFNGTSAILRGLGDSKTPLYFLVISAIVNIALDLLFILVFGMGVAGVALATVISQGGAFITGIIYLNKTHKIVKLTLKKLVFDREIFVNSLRIGLPSGLQQTTVAIGMIAVSWIVNRFGTDTIAAYSIAMRIDQLASLPAMNFAAALTTFVGQNMGANKPERVKAGLWATLKMTSVVSIVITLIALIFPRMMMGLFTDDRGVIDAGAHYLVIVSSFYVIFSSMFVYNGLLRGAGDTLVPMLITIFSLWIIRIPVSVFLSERIGPIGIWWGIPIGWVTGWIFSYFYYLSGKWKTKVIIKPIAIEDPQI